MFSVVTVFIRALLSLWTESRLMKVLQCMGKLLHEDLPKCLLVSLLTSIHGQSWKCFIKQEERKKEGTEWREEGEGRKEEGMGGRDEKEQKTDNTSQ